MPLRTILGCIAYSMPSRVSIFLHKWRGVHFDDPGSVFIGMHVDIDHNHPELVHIGRNVTIAGGSRITAHFHPPKYMESVLPKTRSEIRIGNNVYIGADSIILSGVTIHDWAVVGAGSVVTRDVQSGEIVAGNPAKTIKTFQAPE